MMKAKKVQPVSEEEEETRIYCWSCKKDTPTAAIQKSLGFTPNSKSEILVEIEVADWTSTDDIVAAQTKYFGEHDQKAVLEGTPHCIILRNASKNEDCMDNATIFVVSLLYLCDLDAKKSGLLAFVLEGWKYDFVGKEIEDHQAIYPVSPIVLKESGRKRKRPSKRDTEEGEEEEEVKEAEPAAKRVKKDIPPFWPFSVIISKVHETLFVNDPNVDNFEEGKKSEPKRKPKKDAKKEKEESKPKKDIPPFYPFSVIISKAVEVFTGKPEEEEEEEKKSERPKREIKKKEEVSPTTTPTKRKAPAARGGKKRTT